MNLNTIIKASIWPFFAIGICHAADSTITITGAVKANACAVAVGSKDFTVDLLNNAAKQFSQAGSVTASVPFSIVLSPCGSAATAVKILFNGTADTVNTSLLKLDNVADAAVGIGIQILNSDGSALPINATVSSLNWIPLTASQTNTINYYARLMSTQAPVTAGTVSSTATFTLEFQ